MTLPATPSIELWIEELVLHGFAPEDRSLLVEAIEQEMSRLLAAGGVPPAIAGGGEVAHLDGGAFEVAAGATSSEIGVQVAQAVYRGLGR